MDIYVQASHDEASQVSGDGRGVCVCVMSAAPGRLCSTSHTVHTPSQSLYHSPASENKQEPLKCNCKQKLCGQA